MDKLPVLPNSWAIDQTFMCVTHGRTAVYPSMIFGRNGTTAVEEGPFCLGQAG